MSVAVIIQRIHAALERGDLGAVTEDCAFLAVETMGDLLRPWGEVFPGVEPPTPDEDSEDFRSNRRSMSVLRRPKFMPQPRRSRRLLPAPRPLTGTPKLVHPDLFQAVAAVWDWYQMKEKATPDLLAHPFDFNGIHKFLEPLVTVLWDWYPLHCDLENLGSNGPISEESGLSLRLPYYSYDDPSCGVIEAFLSGPSGVEWLMAHFLGAHDWELPKTDMEIIGSAGWGALAKTYAEAPGEKTYNLQRLENLEESFFKGVKEKYPEQYDQGVDVISDGWGDEVWIKSKDDIEYAIAYAEAFDAMVAELPDAESMEHDSYGITAEFAHELCNVWRRVNGQRELEWQSKHREKGESGRERV